MQIPWLRVLEFPSGSNHLHSDCGNSLDEMANRRFHVIEMGTLMKRKTEFFCSTLKIFNWAYRFSSGIGRRLMEIELKRGE